MTFEQKQAIVRRATRRLYANGVVVSMNPKYRTAVLRRPLGNKLLGAADALVNYGGYRVSYLSR